MLTTDHNTKEEEEPQFVFDSCANMKNAWPKTATKVHSRESDNPFLSYESVSHNTKGKINISPSVVYFTGKNSQKKEVDTVSKKVGETESCSGDGCVNVDCSSHHNNFGLDCRKATASSDPPESLPNDTQGKIQSTDYYSMLSEQQRLVYDDVMAGHSLLICGSAGTGKSFLLKAITESFIRNNVEYAITSSTGISAVNLGAGASTLHMWMGAGNCTGSATEECKKIMSGTGRSHERWKRTDTLIIDEISMISPWLFDKVEEMARILRGSELPFGGMQIVACGDWAQLAPVKDNPPREYNGTTYCFETERWRTVITRVHILNQMFRQKDPEFITLLNEIRRGTVTQKSIDLLRSRVGAKLCMPTDMMAVHLNARTKNVDKINIDGLAQITEELVTFEWHLESKPADLPAGVRKLGEQYLQRSVKVDREITLKKGAPVILLVNMNVELGLVNGLQGVVTAFVKSEGAQNVNRLGLLPKVKFMNGNEIVISPYFWNFTAPGSTSGNPAGVTLSQLPLKLAFAITIHKSQSLTLDFAEMNLDKSIFATGQAYTAISRVKSLSGLSLTDFDINSIKTDPKVIQFYADHGEEDAILALLEAVKKEEENAKKKRRFCDLDDDFECPF